MLASRPGPGSRRPLRSIRSTLASLLAVLVVMGALAPVAIARTPTAAPRGSDGDVALQRIRPDTTPLPDSITGASGSYKPSATASATGAIAKFVVGLGIVVAVIFGVYWLLKSVGRKRLGRAGIDDGALSVVGSTALGPGRMLHLVRVGDDLVLVGAAENAVTRVHAWTGPDAKRLDEAMGISGPGGGPSGARLLEELRRRTVRG